MKYIVTDINEENMFVEMCNSMMKDKDEIILIEVHSSGGITDEAMYLITVMETLKKKGKKVVTYCPVKAFSCGLYIFLSGSIKIASPFSQFLHHEVSLSLNPIVNWWRLLRSKSFVDSTTKIFNELIDLSELEKDYKKIKWWEIKDLLYTAKELKEKIPKSDIIIDFLPQEFDNLELWRILSSNENEFIEEEE